MDTLQPPAPVPYAGKPRFQRLRVISALIIREMSSKFGRSAGGYLWALLTPLGGILLLSVVFSAMVRQPPVGTSFMLFYATGIVPFSMFGSLSGAIGKAIGSNRGLMSYPVVHVLDAVLAKFALNFLTVFLTAVVLYASIILWLGLHVNLDLAAVSLGFLMAAALGLGVGTMNCVLFGFFPTWRNVWGVLTRPLFFVSCIFFTFETLPGPIQNLLWYNPLVHVVGQTRAGFYGMYHAGYVSPAYVLGIGLSLFVVGAYLLRRHAGYLIEDQ